MESAYPNYTLPHHLLAPACDILLFVTLARANTSDSHHAVSSKLRFISILSSSCSTANSCAGVSQQIAEPDMARPAASKWSSRILSAGAFCAYSCIAPAALGINYHTLHSVNLANERCTPHASTLYQQLGNPIYLSDEQHKSHGTLRAKAVKKESL